MSLVFGPIEVAHRGEASVQFFLAIFLFVVVVGLIDLRVPWPKARRRGARE
jgi:hypothetical protein